nr:class II SORL domain-containing protein [uncultured Desulfuromonas sp.]
MDSKISRRELLTKASVVSAGLALGAATAGKAQAADSAAPDTIGASIRSADFKKEKHVPVIEVPSGIVAGQPFDLTVSVGKDIPHPNTTEHFINWITVYFKAAGESRVTELAKFEFTAHGESPLGANKGPAHADPHVSARTRLAKSGTLIAVSYCNIHGLWESSTSVSVA